MDLIPFADNAGRRKQSVGSAGKRMQKVLRLLPVRRLQDRGR